MSKKYSLTVELKEDGLFHVKSTNEGFTGYELLGFLYHKSIDIHRQIIGEIKPNIESRVVKEGEK